MSCPKIGGSKLENWGSWTEINRKRGVDYVQRMKLCCPICHSTFSYVIFLPFLFRHGVSCFTTYELVLFLYYCLRPSLNFVLFPQFLLLLSILTVTLCHFDSMVWPLCTSFLLYIYLYTPIGIYESLILLEYTNWYKYGFPRIIHSVFFRLGQF